MTVEEKKDLIRFIGERLHELYKAKTITIPVSYDLSTVTKEESVKDLIDRFFLLPYDVYIENLKEMEPGSPDYNAFIAVHPDIVREAEYVATTINSLIVEWVERRNQAKTEKQMLNSMYVDEKLRETVKNSIEMFGVKKNG